jgi:putative ABC transport system permease protein
MTRRRPPASSWAGRTYRRLIAWLPPDFRGDFGDHMTRDFDERDRELSGAARRRFHARELPALLRLTAAQWAEAAWRDLGFTLRMMARTPGFATAAVLMLAIGTGASAAVFSVVDAVILRPSASDPSRLATIQEQAPGRPASGVVPASHLATLAQAPEFDGVAGITGVFAVLTGVGPPHRIDLDCVSASLFHVSGVTPLVGRVFTAVEDRAGADPVVVLAYDEWQRDFGGRTDVVGQPITLNGVSNTVIGVMPRGFLGPFDQNRRAGWAPLAPAIGGTAPSGCRVRPGGNVSAVARIRRPLTLDQAAARINASGLVGRLAAADGSHPKIVLDRADFLIEEVETPLVALAGAVVCLLLIACANVANLQLERLVGRRREIAVRLALGATRSRIVRQTMVENLIIAIAGAGGGLLAARLLLQAMVALMPAWVPHVNDIAIDARTLAATACAAIAAGLAVGLFPAIQATRHSLSADLNQGSRGSTNGAVWMRRSLVIVEVALSVVLLVSAGLMIRTFVALRPADPGFETANRTVAEILFDGDWKPSPDRERTIGGVVQRVRALPGIAAVSAASYLPLSGSTDLAHATVGDFSKDVWTSFATPGFMGDMAQRLMRGRFFAETDDASAPPVAIVNEAMAARFWPRGDPLGQLVEVRTEDKVVAKRRVVGVVETTRSWGTDVLRRSQLYIPYAQAPGSTLMYVLVRTNGAPPQTLATDIRRIVADVRPGQVVWRVESLQTKVDRSVDAPRFAMWIFSAFAAAGAALASLGLFAVIAWWVSERRREIGVRMALGAGVERIARLVLGEGLALAAVGLALGMATAFLVTRLLSDWLYDVAKPTDPETYALCAVGMLLVTATASYIPARRAARIDPTVTLRSE